MAAEKAAEELGGGHGITGELMFDGFILLGASLGFVLLFRRLGLGAVLGYLIAGIAIGPFGLALVGRGESILSVAEIGIVLLLFLVGLELAPARLWRLRRDIFGLGLSQVVLCGLAVTGLVLLGTNLTIAAALAIGLPLGLSSTAQVLPLLQSEGRLNTPLGERAFSVLLFQDLSIVPLLTVVAVLSRAPADPGAPPGWLLAIYAVAAIVGLVVAGRYILNPLLALVGRFAERELFIVTGLFTVFAAAALMDSLGLSMALGAFVAGVMLADSPYRHELEADVDPFRSILLGLFFLAVGMMLDVDVVLAQPLFVIGMAAALVVTKVAIIFGLAMAFGVRARAAFVLGLLLSQGGEFAFVLFTEAERALLVTDAASSLFGAVVTLSMATTPFLMALAKRFGGVRASARDDMEGPEDAPTPGAIVVGHGRFGQTVAQMLTGANIPVTLIDSKPDQIDLSGEFGRKVYFGDGLRVDLLREAGAEHASAILFCNDGTDLDNHRLDAVRMAFPNVKILARVFDRRHLLGLEQGQLDGVFREVLESAIAMARKAMELVDLDESLIDRVEEEYRKRDCTRLAMQSAEGSLHAGSEMSFGAADSLDFDGADKPGD
ncbi:cation:proton antiporter [Parasphingopyxis lamellibrachiae]|uniref:Kef-type potassium/proton antiporter (CPA2 family) n=1 Tax=Parasphingopyxis lamellibrachiae TaxID=680125 RepID=A0A3D9FFR6_9SPHN|nr:cation:proton antiporter [Parasphingopyxis lamellibrachiae]RED15931.1 Kef-type potassium/proton antiporter (CPA2 family) [Parasphingopyxis lamellibrachiae]